MPSIFDFASMLLGQSLSGQVLSRTPEPAQLTDRAENVVQYDRVMATKLAIAYAAGLETIHRARSGTSGDLAFDLACGPGHFTLCLARYLNCEQVSGFDLSAPMVATATRNAVLLGLGADAPQSVGTGLSADPRASRDDRFGRSAPLLTRGTPQRAFPTELSARNAGGRVSFALGDATNLTDCDDQSVDLCCFTDAAHHMPDLTVVSDVLTEMDRVTRPDGLVMVMDLVRLATRNVTERYVQTLAHDYVARGLPSFYDDFRNSMYAAWTAAELRQAIPTDTERVWCHIVPRGLPTIQFLLGLPVGRDRPFVRTGWSAAEHPLIREWFPRWERDVSPHWARETLTEFKVLKMSLRFASMTLVHPRARLAARLSPVPA